MKSKNYRIIRWLLLCIISVITIGISLQFLVFDKAINSSRTSDLSDGELARALLIEPSNLPTLWSPGLIDTNSLSVAEGAGASRWFAESDSRAWVNVFQDVFVFPSSVQAERHYDELMKKYSKLEYQGWDSMPNLRFPHHADTTHLACHESYVNNHHHFGCYVIGRYGRIVTVVGGHIFDQRWLTAEQFQHVLTEVDAKLVGYLDSAE